MQLSLHFILAGLARRMFFCVTATVENPDGLTTSLLYSMTL